MPPKSHANGDQLKKRSTARQTSAPRASTNDKGTTPKSAKSSKSEPASRYRTSWRWLSWACSAALFLLAVLTYRNGGELPFYLLGRSSSARQQPWPTQQHPSSPPASGSSSKPAVPKDLWGKAEKPYYPSNKREPSLPYSLPPTRPLPDQPLRRADADRQEAVLGAFKHSWSAYRRDAWGYDEYHPISKHGSNLSGKHGQGIGYTIVDTLDTLILMGLKDDYEEARDWVRDELSWDVPGRMNVFETTIRTLGGLLSAAALIRDPPHPAFTPNEEDAQMFIDKAVDLAERLKPAFDTPSGVPLREVDLETGEAFPDLNNNNSSSLAEATTVQLEFKYLAHLTGEHEYWRIAERPMEVVRNATKRLIHYQGLLPIFLNPMNGHFYNGEVRLGSRGDSYYEYLIKQWLQTGRSEDVYRDMYDNALRGIKRLLTKPSIHSKPPLMFTVELAPRRMPDGRPYMQLVPKQDHLVCFLGGSMMLGSTSLTDIFGDTTKRPLPPISDVGTGDETDREDWRLGHELVRTCMDTYTRTATGLSPEIAFFVTPTDANITEAQMLAANRAPIPRNVDWYIKKPPPSYSKRPNPLIDARNILRPETVESLFIAFSLTGDEIYREWGWQIFQAFEKHCKVPSGGYSSIDDVDSKRPKQMDKMETFWLSETLKYLYLLFGDRDTLPLNKWVLNTEAHPLPVFTPRFETGFS
ncbi:Glycoside hydrolase, family 47 [Kalmanozyma brasiliensis GHG001]|uniref:Glycoside hydrolase, family 47 n=1 Tax=Kalmanozyma brasiliensis (strain GHG001) TaxID=1365824 RepID=UPI001CE85E59|nr:Glycoside hydrolase, family 47 [Kalmanozyma brasiliensis GHG001]EST04831.2 Glycoside hydrolase, family 47 [Kalmanozyma brasiliensis GHG001]